MVKSTLILGSGFGLYGYLPAARNISWAISTDARYRSEIFNRPELRHLFDYIHFLDNPELSINSFDCVVIAKKPKQQIEILNDNLNYQGHFFLEKPLAPTIQHHREILNLLKQSNLKFTIGYLFRYLKWYQQLIILSKTPFKIFLRWHISPIASGSWKISTEEGGGLVNYYLIHFIPLLIEMGFKETDLKIRFDNGILELVTSNNLGSLSIEIIQNMKLTSNFSIGINTYESLLWKSTSPFGDNPIFGKPDPRIEYLTQYLQNSSDSTDPLYSVLLEEKILNFLESIKYQITLNKE
jgi:hypothetical protein